MVDTLQEFEQATSPQARPKGAESPMFLGSPHEGHDNASADSESSRHIEELRARLADVTAERDAMSDAFALQMREADEMEKLARARGTKIKEVESDIERAGKRAALAEKIAVETKSKMEHLIANLPASTWEVCRTEDSGHVYYFNSVTKTSTWQAPHNSSLHLPGSARKG